MATRAYTSLLDRVTLHAQHCPTPVIEQALSRAAIRACERTLLWRHAEPLRTLDPGVHVYDYAKPADSDVHAVFGAYLNDYPLDRITLEQALERYPAWADLYSGEAFASLWSSAGGSLVGMPEFDEAPFDGPSGYTTSEASTTDGSTPRAVCQITPDKFVVLPLPDDEQTYRLRMFYALRPTRTATGLPEAVFDELEDAIYHSALHEIMTTPGTTWVGADVSDSRAASMRAEKARYHAQQFAVEVAQRRARANLGNARGSMSVQMRPFA